MDGVKNANIRAEIYLKYLCNYYPQFKQKDKKLSSTRCRMWSWRFPGLLQAIRMGCTRVMIQIRQHVKAAKEFLNLDVECIEGEKMELEGTFDVIVIIGSLEHCQDQRKLKVMSRSIGQRWCNNN